MIDLLAPFQYDFMQRAFVAAIVVGGLCSTMGTYVVLRKLSFIGDGIAHASFAGIVIAYLRNSSYYIGSGVVAVLTALAIGYTSRRGRVSFDTAIGVLFTGMFALGVFLMSQSQRYTIDLQDYLFGNILAVTPNDLLVGVCLAAIVAGTVVVLYRPLLYASFDPTVAQASGINVAFADYILLTLIALTIIVSLQTIGIILVAALLVTPAAAAQQLTRRFGPMMATSATLG
ncbi:MAG: metal ABC transporter permease, partial [Candidatus Eremiobacteraeota bacterium]|nr:metal ABC transporter permease [Candidatus Eremiobacteraeota bacterium]